MKDYTTASKIMLAHGIFGIIRSILLIPGYLQHYNTFIMISICQFFCPVAPYMQGKLYLIMVIGGCLSILRIVCSRCLLKHGMCGLMLSLVSCVITIPLMIYILPAGTIDIIITVPTLVILLKQYFKNKKVSEANTVNKNYYKRKQS